jgi:hypothetical protein
LFFSLQVRLFPLKSMFTPQRVKRMLLQTHRYSLYNCDCHSLPFSVINMPFCIAGAGCGISGDARLKSRICNFCHKVSEIELQLLIPLATLKHFLRHYLVSSQLTAQFTHLQALLELFPSIQVVIALPEMPTQASAVLYQPQSLALLPLRNKTD